jgi:uncharacterized protein YgbK (DUF1537 family)
MAFLGCIADDFTGATDLANNLVREGMRTVQVIGVPALDTLTGANAPEDIRQADAIVVALKSRTAPANEAIAQSRAALAVLQQAGCQRSFFKYCSTFDSTPEGNIGPVAEALLADLDADFAIAAPGFPATGRTLEHGVLWVNGVPLNESGMQHHPLTPMTDANLVRWLGVQSQGEVGLIDADTIDAGVDAVRERAADLLEVDVRLAIVDTLSVEHLNTLAAAFADQPLITGGSGIALGLPAAYEQNGDITRRPNAGQLDAFGGHCAIVSGSCSTQTQAQVAAFAVDHPALALDPLALAEDAEQAITAALDWARPKLTDGPVLIYSTDAPEAVAAAQAKLGDAQAGALVESALARISQGLVDAGVRRLIVAGGETSGAVVSALGVEWLRIGPQIDPGVPWTSTQIKAINTEHSALAPDAAAGLALALKSGNFGGTDFFTRAFTVCP